MMNYKVVARKNPMTKEVKYYAQLVLATPVRLAALAEEISQQCTVTAHDVKVVLSAMEEHILRHLLNGKSVHRNFYVAHRFSGIVFRRNYVALRNF